MVADRKVLAKRSRTKGQAFEREIVNRVKDRFKDRWWAKNVRRSDQTHRAHLPDVTGVPGVWLELETAAQPAPKKKHAQATRDSAKFPDALPVAVIRKKATKRIYAHLTLGDLTKLVVQANINAREGDMVEDQHENILVRVELPDFFDLLDASEVPELTRP